MYLPYIFPVDFSKLFDKEALIKRIKEQGKALTKLVVSERISKVTEHTKGENDLFFLFYVDLTIVFVYL